MAWISVHDHVVGRKSRELAKEIKCSQKEALGILVTLWLWGINNADKTGELKSADRQDVADAISVGLSDGLRPADIVDALISTNWIDEIEETLYLHDWDQWQEQWYKFLSQKEYDAKRKREARQRAKQEQAQEGGNAPDKGLETSEDNPQDGTESGKKDKKTIKIKIAEFVKMTAEENEKLVEQYGKRFADKCIEVLNNYKGANGKRYKSDYLAILNWVTDKVQKEYPSLRVIQNTEQNNPFEQYR